MGKQTVLSRDVPGFIANRILIPWINEAIFCLQEGVATKENIDKCMKLGNIKIRLISRNKRADGSTDSGRLRRPGHRFGNIKSAI